MKSTYSSSQGPINIFSHKGKLLYVNWDDESCLRKMEKMAPYICAPASPSDLELLHETSKQLEEYFSGNRHRFSLPLEIQGTEFQKKVWQEIQNINYGSTLSYKELAKLCGKPGAVRAVANACGANPLAIIIPCHRVVGTNGEIGGYTGGIDKKIALLNHENQKIFG